MNSLSFIFLGAILGLFAAIYAVVLGYPIWQAVLIYSAVGTLFALASALLAYWIVIGREALINLSEREPWLPTPADRAASSGK